MLGNLKNDIRCLNFRKYLLDIIAEIFLFRISFLKLLLFHLKTFPLKEKMSKNMHFLYLRYSKDFFVKLILKKIVLNPGFCIQFFMKIQISIEKPLMLNLFPDMKVKIFIATKSQKYKVSFKK